MSVRTSRSLGAAVGALALATAAGGAHAQIVQNGSFELPSIGAGNNSYTVPTGWSAVGSSVGIINGTGTGFQTPSVAPDGNQVAFLQFNNPNTPANATRLYQSVVLPSSGNYRLTFYDAGRGTGGFNSFGNTIFDVLLGSTVLGTFTTVSNSSYALQTINFAAGAGTYTLAFAYNAAQPNGDNTFFLDNVQITAAGPITTTPEPASFALVGAGLAAAGTLARRRRRA